VVLQEEALGARGVHDNLVYALPELGIFFRHEHDPDAAVRGAPGDSGIVRDINAAGRNRHIHAPAVGWIGNYRVQAEPAESRGPA
jgi:hypothetical protein